MAEFVELPAGCHVQKLNHQALTQAINFFPDGRNSGSILFPMAKVIIVPSGDAPMLSVLSFFAVISV